MTNQAYYRDLFNRKTDDRFYVYVHYRVSDGKPFYVGKGNGGRAWNRSSRNAYWKRVVDKHGLRVEVIFDHLTEEESFQVEKDTILEFKYFGYELSNFTGGGEGVVGYKFSEEQRRKMSNTHKGKKLSDEHKNNVSVALKHNYRDKTEYCFVNKNGEVFSGTKSDFAKKYKLESCTVTRLIKTGSSRDWVVVVNEELPENALLRIANKKKLSRAVKTVYTFVNKNTEEVFVGTRMQLVEKFGVDRVNLSQVFNKANGASSASGWGVLGEDEEVPECLYRLRNKRTLSKADKTVYKFIHDNGAIFTGTRVELCLKYDLDFGQIGNLLSNTRRRNKCHGWSLLKE